VGIELRELEVIAWSRKKSYKRKSYRRGSTVSQKKNKKSHILE